MTIPLAPTTWHKKPAGTSGKACSICGYPAKRRGLHRTTLPNEGYYRQWLHRAILDGKWVEIEVGNPHGGFRRIRDATREKIAIASKLYARGATLVTIAGELDVSVDSINVWRQHHPSIWKHDYHAELHVIETEAAELPEARPDRHVMTTTPYAPVAAADDDLTEAQRMPLLAFLYDVYVPSRMEISPPAISQAEITIRLFERWAGRSLRIGDFKEDLIRRFLLEMLKTRAGSTVNSKRTHLLAFWKCAWEEGILPELPRKIRRAKVVPTIPEAWTEEEVGRILFSARQSRHPIAGIPGSDWWMAFLLVIYDTGERRGAMFATAPRDVNLADAYVVFRNTKTGRPRLCALHPDTVEACGRIYDPERELMFPFASTTESLQKRFRKILWRAKVTFGRGHGGLFHKLRRTSGTLVEQAGGDGAKHIGNTRAVFESNYLDPRFGSRRSLEALPRPIMPLLLTHEQEGPDQ